MSRFASFAKPSYNNYPVVSGDDGSKISDDVVMDVAKEKSELAKK